LHFLDRRLVLGYPDRPTDHIYPTPPEGISMIGVAPEFRGSKITPAATPVRKWVARSLFKEPPQVEVLNAAITMDVMTGSALAQTDRPQSVCISTGILLSFAKISKIIEGNLREASKIVWFDACE
jgi:hypothetical protein